MNFKEKLIELRKRRGWSQEELGNRLDVSRQTVSKWESGETTPEMSKLILLSRIFGVSSDELLGLSVPDYGNCASEGCVRRRCYEYKSRREIAGLPLVHVNLGRGLKRAKGVIAIGNIATGGVAVGAVSAGIVSMGVVSVGLLSLGVFALGLVSLGSIAAGLLAAGGISLGYLALGGVARGIYAVGGLALARDIAVGGAAFGHIAVGETARGVVTFALEGGFPEISSDALREAILLEFPDINRCIFNLFVRLASGS